MALSNFGIGQGLDVDESFSIIHGVGVAGSFGGQPDIVNQGSLYNDDSTGILYRKHAAGTGTGVWSIVGTEKAPVEVLGVTGSTLVDSIPTKKAKSMVWSVDLENDIVNTDRTFFEVRAGHDGTSTVDAVSVTFNVTGLMRIGAGAGVFNTSVVLSGAGASQTMDLYIG